MLRDMYDPRFWKYGLIVNRPEMYLQRVFGEVEVQKTKSSTGGDASFESVLGVSGQDHIYKEWVQGVNYTNFKVSWLKNGWNNKPCYRAYDNPSLKVGCECAKKSSWNKPVVKPWWHKDRPECLEIK